MFLRLQDYFSAIRENDLDNILEEIERSTSRTPTVIRQDAETAAQAKISTMLCHRYDTKLIFKDILTWDVLTQFNIGELVEYSEAAYSETATYATDDLVSFKSTTNNILNDKIYKNTVAVTSPEVFNPDKWVEQGTNNALYVVREQTITTKPVSDFTYTVNAFTGSHDSILGWDTTNDIFLKRNASSVKIYYSAADRTNDVNSIGVVDVGTQVKTFPQRIPIESGDDAENTLSGNLTIIGYMPDLSEWSVVATNPFQLEDNRHRIIIDIMIALVIFKLHGLISYRNIPDYVGDAKEDAMDWLNSIKSGEICTELPLYHDETIGQKIAYGSEPKNNYTYFC